MSESNCSSETSLAAMSDVSIFVESMENKVNKFDIDV